MSKAHKPKTATPRLRFPEFRDKAAWRFKPLKAVGERMKQRNSDESIGRVLTNSAEHGVLDQRDFFDKDIATAGKLDNYFVVDVGDYVYNPRISRTAPVGPISRNNVGQGVMSPLYTVFRLGENGADFHEHYFATNGWHDYLRSVSSTGARHDRMSIGIADFMKLPIPLPDPAEQRKIAACLGSLDDWIAAESRELAALRRHKTGLMQQLFPRPGQTRPRLRFPEFQNTGEWEERKVGSLGDVVTGSTPSTKNRDLYGGPHPFISPANISDDRYVVEGEATLSDEGLAQARSIPAGSVLFVCIGSTIGKVAQARHLCATNQQINAVIPTTGTEAGFIYFSLGEASVRIASIAGRHAVPIINKKQFARTRLLVPTLAEQRRIADCLAALDARLSAQSEKLAALRHHKRGLMQQLFPSAEGASNDQPDKEAFK